MCALFRYLGCVLGDLDGVKGPCGVHSGGFVHRVAPNIKNGFTGPDHSPHQRAVADTCKSNS